MVKWSNIRFKIPSLLRNKYIITALVFILWITVFDKSNLIDWIESRMEFRRMRSEKTYYEKQLKITSDALQQLRSNNDSLEKFAREHYGFHNLNEEVYIVEE